MRTISILGCGWLGLPLAKELLNQGYVVKGSTTTLAKIAHMKSAGIEPFILDLNDLNSVENSDFFQCDVLILNFPPKRIDNVVDVYASQIELCKAEIIRNSISAVLFISSTSVYPNTGKLVSEIDLSSPEKPGGFALLNAENVLRKLSITECTVLRLAGLIGDDRIPGKRFNIKAISMTGNEKVNLVHRDDCIAIILKIIQLKKWKKVYNVCMDNHPFKKELYSHTAKIFGFNEPVFSGTNPKFKIVDNQLLKDELGYRYIYPDPMKIY